VRASMASVRPMEAPSVSLRRPAPRVKIHEGRQPAPRRSGPGRVVLSIKGRYTFGQSGHAVGLAARFPPTLVEGFAPSRRHVDHRLVWHAVFQGGRSGCTWNLTMTASRLRLSGPGQILAGSAPRPSTAQASNRDCLRKIERHPNKGAPDYNAKAPIPKFLLNNVQTFATQFPGPPKSK